MKKNFWLLVTTLSLLFVTTACGSEQNKTIESTSHSTTVSTKKSTDSSVKTDEINNVSIKMSLIEDGKQIISEDLKANSDQSVLDVLKENFEVKETNGFVTEIDGKAQDKAKNKYWMYYINGKEADKGAKDIKVKNNDIIEWRLNELK